ncbi:MULTISPECIES: AAA family ATPase [unclassified Variovorax]|uniref:AAA family ATPase n=1 Tax=unclassified Variovorax TaxID=663243 RepID=UPI003F45AE06
MPTAIRDIYENMEKVRPISVRDFLSIRITGHNPLLEGMIREHSVARFLVEPGVNPRWFQVVLACSLAAGRDLGPFAVNRPCKVWVLSGSGDPESDQFRFSKVLETFDENERETASKNLTIYQRTLARDDPMELDTVEGQEVFEKSIPADCEVVLIDDVAVFTKRGQLDRYARDAVESWAKLLSRRNTVIALFMEGLSSGRLMNEERTSSTISLTIDAAAPGTYGTGCVINRQRLDDSDVMPRCASFWQTCLEDKMDYGIEVHPHVSEGTFDPEATARLERKILVGKMKLQKKSNKEIAFALALTEAMVSRDLKDVMESEALAAASRQRKLDEEAAAVFWNNDEDESTAVSPSPL